MRRKDFYLITASSLCILTPLTASHAKGRLELNFDEGQTIDEGATMIRDPKRGRTFPATIDKGTRASNRPQIVKTGCNTPPACLRVSLDPSRMGAAKNKIMYSFWSHYRPLPGGETNRIRIGDQTPVTVSFAMKLDRQYDTPAHQMIHFQMFQAEKSGVNHAIEGKLGGPVLSLRIVPQSRRKNKSPDVEEFVIAVRSPEALGLKAFDNRDRSVLYRGVIRKGEWNRFSFRLSSGPKAVGSVAFDLNGKRMFDRRLTWGFDPNKYPVNAALGFEVGSYRSADLKGRQTVYFDDISVDRS